jgi:subtilisin family serine protease
LRKRTPPPRRRRPPSSARRSFAKSTDAVQPLRTAAAKAEVVVYVHGILNKPRPSVLKCQWDNALFGVDMGDRTRMAYWVNRTYYPTPLNETCAQADRLIAHPEEQALVRTLGLGPTESDPAWLREQIQEIGAKPKDRARLERLGRRLLAQASAPPRPTTRDVRVRVLPLLPALRKWITRLLTGAFLRDVNDFLFRPDEREAMEAPLRERLEAGGGPFVVIGHSQGSMIAYDVLRTLSRNQCNVPLFVTIGSPLGLDEVQDVFRDWTGVKGKLPIPPCVERWVNVADPRDLVAADATLANDFLPKDAIEDVEVLNPDRHENPHSGTGYLRISEVRDRVVQFVGTQFAQPVRRFIIARDLVRSIENAGEARHPVLIELKARQPEDRTRVDLREAKSAVLGGLKRVVGPTFESDADVDVLQRFVAAKLTRFQVERLSSELGNAKISFIWANSRKRALTWMSAQRTQVLPAQVGHGALGADIEWAVLDTGVNEEHDHFQTHKNVVAQWDCTRRGEPKEGAPDRDGHGTHVAGIVAGVGSVDLLYKGRLVRPTGMAPAARLHVYKVLGDDGQGQDSWIVKALDHVAQVNEAAGGLLIQGINLSLGGSFDPSVFGCGHSPLCQELRRLWQQGVLVCIAAGNEGYAVLQSDAGAIEANIDLSIGDPANLDEAIAVGSVHKESPHIYGVSYFSSRGPTADGRLKPDLVAPGERILSARHDVVEPPEEGSPIEDFYVEMSGTSMAAPHVSGGLAAFLSVRREFLGYPDKVKELLMRHCTDLRRDPYVQGRGLMNVLQMLIST